jgi:ribonuclease-3
MRPQSSDVNLDKLELGLGYEFADKALLALALTHRGVSSVNNERLEFLGDAALGLAVAELLYQRYPEVQEHHLSLMRANVVNREALAAVAREIHLGDYLRLGPGELRSGGFRRDSILSNTLEAILGAALIDGGVDAVRELVVRLLGGRLQELMQARRLPLPEYRIKAQDGEAHEPVFLVECRLADLGVAVEARAGNRRDAEKAAAQRALDLLDEQP